jgi:phosphatidylinositol 3-kinase
MATTEAVIPSAAQHAKDYDIFNLVQPQGEFIPCSEVQEPFRVRIVGIEGHPVRDGGGMDLEVRVSLAAYGREIVAPVQTAPSTGGRIEEWVYFPLTYGELPVDALVCCTVVAPGEAVVGGCTFHVFTSRGAAKRGPRRYKLHAGKEADPLEDTGTLGHTETDAWQHLARDFRQNRMQSVPWLDALATTRIRKMEAEGSGAAANAAASAGRGASSPSLAPETSFAVIGGQSASVDEGLAHLTQQPDHPAGDVEEDPALLFLSIELPTTSTGQPLYRTSYSTSFAEARKRSTNYWGADATPLAPFPDLAVGSDNLCEQKAMLLARSTNLVHDPDAKPSANERRYLERIAQQPPIAAETGGFTAEQAGLLWRYRRYVTADPKLFRPFMASIDWSSEKEAAEAAALIQRWKPVTLADALGLLATSVKPLRAHAVALLGAESDATMVLLLLQLVQAMRFDTAADELYMHLLERAARSWRLCSFMFWYLCVEADLEERGAATLCKGTKEGLSSTRLGYCRLSPESYNDRRLRMLAHMEAAKPEFHRRLVGQQELRAVLTNLYTAVKEDLTKDRTQKMAAASELIKESKCGIAELFSNGQVVYLPSHPHLAVKGISPDGVYMFKSAKMPIKLDFLLAHDADVTDEAITARFPSGGDIPAVAVADVSADASTSARLGDEQRSTAALLKPESNRGRSSSLLAPDALQVTQSSSLGRSGAFEEPAKPVDSTSLALMFKCGDDVRQDQLVIQFIELMDALLKQNGLNLWLTPYRALATSQNDGFVELVPDCKTFQDIQKLTVVKHLHGLHPTPAGYDRALGKFVKSTAGYCVITFLLGIGDRHLENLLVIKDGRLFHVDFGFFMGKDPKPFPPPMKLNKEMVDTMGGASGKQYRNFRTYCCSAFNILRAHAPLLLNLLLLMSDASIPNLDDDGKVDPRVNIARVQDKLRLDLNDAEASQYFLGVINDSLGARFTNLWDKVHEVAQDVRH